MFKPSEFVVPEVVVKKDGSHVSLPVEISTRFSGPAATNWEVTACIPVVETCSPRYSANTIPMLRLGVELLRLQSLRPYILIIDTGSTPENCAELESMRADDLEISYIRCHGVQHPSDLVAFAMDLAQTMCRTPYLFHTHSDVWLTNWGLLEGMREIVKQNLWVDRDNPSLCPVVGYEMSPRPHPGWQGMVSHTATMLDVDFIHSLGITWNQRRLANRSRKVCPDLLPNGCVNYFPEYTRPNWPDTEVGFNCLLQDKGFRPTLIGYEKNYERTRDEHIDHVRSITGSSLYDPKNLDKMREVLRTASEEAKIRAIAWRNGKLQTKHPIKVVPPTPGGKGADGWYNSPSARGGLGDVE